MTYAPVYKEPPGYTWSVIERGDRLDTLAAKSGVRDVEIAAKNGVPFFGSKSCAWGRDIASWVLGVGHSDIEASKHGAPPNRLRVGFRQPFVEAQPNVCESGLGFPSFSVGQVILLPTGTRTPFIGAQPAQRSGLSTGVKVLLGLGVAGAAAAAFTHSKRRKAA